MEKITESGGCSGSSPIRRRLKRRITRMLLLHSTCTITAAGDLVKLSKCTLPKQKLVDYSQQESFIPRARRAEEKTRKKERRLTEVGDLYVTGEGEGRKCPPASPSSPTRNCCRHWSRQAGNRKKKKKSYGRGKETSKLPANNAYRVSSSSSLDCNDELGLYSSTEEEEDEEWSGTLFSSRTLSSDSSGFYCSNRKTTTATTKKKKKKSRNLASFLTASLKEKVEAERSVGFAVVKDSSDPYMDFLSSMVEMILDLQVSSVSDMEKLLDSYLGLNSTLVHPLILEAFVDVWEALSLGDRFDSISLRS